MWGIGSHQLSLSISCLKLVILPNRNTECNETNSLKLMIKFIWILHFVQNDSFFRKYYGSIFKLSFYRYSTATLLEDQPHYAEHSAEMCNFLLPTSYFLFPNSQFPIPTFNFTNFITFILPMFNS